MPLPDSFWTEEEVCESLREMAKTDPISGIGSFHTPTGAPIDAIWGARNPTGVVKTLAPVLTTLTTLTTLKAWDLLPGNAKGTLTFSHAHADLVQIPNSSPINLEPIEMDEATRRFLEEEGETS